MKIVVLDGYTLNPGDISWEGMEAFGELTVDIQTSTLKHNLSERGGLMEIRYSIAVEHTVTGRNRFKIRVKRKG